jgi:hypothetical protein
MYPFEGVFYTVTIDESLPLYEQREERVDVLITECDITEASHTTSSNFISAKYSVYFPFNPDDDEVEITIGMKFEADMYGVNVNGRVIGVFPSQLGGIVTYIEDIDA